jgi:hypothetical protein
MKLSDAASHFLPNQKYYSSRILINVYITILEKLQRALGYQMKKEKKYLSRFCLNLIQNLSVQVPGIFAHGKCEE